MFKHRYHNGVVSIIRHLDDPYFAAKTYLPSKTASRQLQSSLSAVLLYSRTNLVWYLTISCILYREAKANLFTIVFYLKAREGSVAWRGTKPASSLDLSSPLFGSPALKPDADDKNENRLPDAVDSSSLIRYVAVVVRSE